MMTFHAVESESDAEAFGEDWDTEGDFESALKNVGGAFQKNGPQVLSGTAQGAATGATMGGPWGAFIGGGFGAAQSIFSAATRKGGGRRPAGTQAATPRPVAPSAFPGSGPAPAAPAAAQLLQVLSSQPLQQALLSAVAPGAAPPSVSVGGTNQPGADVPVGALLALLGSLAAQAADEAESYSDDDAYLRGADGGYRCDPAVEAERHGVLLELLTDSVDGDEPELDAEAWLGSALGG